MELVKTEISPSVDAIVHVPPTGPGMLNVNQSQGIHHVNVLHENTAMLQYNDGQDTNQADENPVGVIMRSERIFHSSAAGTGWSRNYQCRESGRVVAIGNGIALLMLLVGIGRCRNGWADWF